MDENKLADEYIAQHQFEPIRVQDKSRTVQDLLDRGKENFIAFIRMLKGLEIQPDEEGRDCVIFGCKAIRDGDREMDTYMCYLDDIMRDDSPTHYAYTYTDFAQVMGFYIAGTPYVKKHIDEILVDILYEMSFTGYTQEEKDAERRKLEEAIEECKDESNLISIDELYASYGIEREPPDEEADALRRKVYEAENAFNQFCFRREVRLIREMLREGSGD